MEIHGFREGIHYIIAKYNKLLQTVLEKILNVLFKKDRGAHDNKGQTVTVSVYDRMYDYLEECQDTLF